MKKVRALLQGGRPRRWPGGSDRASCRSRCPCPRLGLLTYRVPARPARLPPVRRARRRAARPPHAHRRGRSASRAAALDAAIDHQATSARCSTRRRSCRPTSWQLHRRGWREYYLAGPGAALAAALPPHALADARGPLQDRARGGAHGRGTRRGRAPAARSPRCAEPNDGGCPGWARASARRCNCWPARPRACRRPTWPSAACPRRPLARLKALGLVARARASASTAIRSSQRGSRRRREDAAARRADRRATGAPWIACVPLADDRRVPRGAAARRDRQRQDRGLPAPGRGACARPGRGVLMLVPEIALTPQVAALFRARVRRRAWPSSTAACRTASGTTSGTASAAATSTSSSARGRRCSRRSRASASSSSTRSTTRPTSRTRRRATTAATWPSCAASSPARWSCSARPRRRWRRISQRAGGPVRAGHARAARARPAAGRACASSNMREEYRRPTGPTWC